MEADQTSRSAITIAALEAYLSPSQPHILEGLEYRITKIEQHLWGR